jgi:D-alanyl-D-alanine carboxypeptidase/D-alanyl-D-alanine-endopeptidase (penicillin-binding protein 4)
VERAPGSSQLDVWGQIPLGAEESMDTVAIPNPPQLTGEIFRRALEARGITVRGRVDVHQLTRHQAATGPEAFPTSPRRIVLAEHVSLPLRESLKVVNKVSQNLHAEMLLRTLGREVKNYGTLTVGLEVLSEFAAQAGVLPGEVQFADGSGLSRQNLVTPRAVVKLLQYMARSPRFDVFYDSLPVAGVDGSLAGRLGNSLVEGRIRAKTGAMEHVNALSGYMDLPSGRRLAFAILGNSHPLDTGRGARLVDQLALAIFRQFGGQPRKR